MNNKTTQTARRIPSNTPFQKLPDAALTTGLSTYFLRQGCKTGTIPFIKSGTTYYINVPALLCQFNAAQNTNDFGGIANG